MVSVPGVGVGGRAFDADFLNARMYPHVTLTPAPRPCNDGLLVIYRPLLCLLVIVWASVSLPLTGRHELLRLTREGLYSPSHAQPTVLSQHSCLQSYSDHSRC